MENAAAGVVRSQNPIRHHVRRKVRHGMMVNPASHTKFQIVPPVAGAAGLEPATLQDSASKADALSVELGPPIETGVRPARLVRQLRWSPEEPAPDRVPKFGHPRCVVGL